jgi:hypothetical protein
MLMDVCKPSEGFPLTRLDFVSLNLATLSHKGRGEGREQRRLMRRKACIVG